MAAPVPRKEPRELSQLALFGCLSLAVARVQRVELFPTEGLHVLRGLSAGAVLYAAAVAFMRPRWRRAVENRVPAAHLFVAENARNAPGGSWWRCWQV